MDPRMPNNGSADSQLQLILELQRQQQQQQQLQQQQQQQQAQQAQQQQQAIQTQPQQQQTSSVDLNLLSGIQALFMQPSQQSINQSNLQQLGLGLGLAQSLGNQADIGQSIQQREANQLLMRQQNIDELLMAAARSQQQQQQQSQLSNTAQLAALLTNSGWKLTSGFTPDAAAGFTGWHSGGGTGTIQYTAATTAAGESKDSSEKGSENGRHKQSAPPLDSAKTAESGPAAAAAAAKKDEEESESEVDEAEEGEDEEDHPANDTFPFKLHRMLEHAENSGMDNLISFSEDGKAFSIHKPREFVSDIMPKYFTTSRMSSFQRQLNLYGFRRVTEGRDKGSYYHKYFLKGRRGLCKKIKRKKANAKPQAYDANTGMQATANTMSIRELLAQRQYQSMYPGLSAGLSAMAGGGVPPPLAAPHDANQTLLANSQLSQQLEILVRQKQQEEARHNQAQQQQQQPKQPFPPFGSPGGPNSGAPL
eukprot:CAMPEP_0168752170 /NCGR_PEP_ID=MMETSP0724-20121128/18244_1 /TAXON_ID=265536 /ORGANISM="Amphiprora sp., Strain CCMP467" /LENGTH=477 /DNA_ID=CAMNT_0008800403 /DNA_START=215 /DNA_END=1650 /DNA_ORIENTATION=+